jgi:hypothetical protein
VDGFIGADWLDTDISGSHMLQVGMKMVRIFSDRIRDRIRLEEF